MQQGFEGNITQSPTEKEMRIKLIFSRSDTELHFFCLQACNLWRVIQRSIVTLVIFLYHIMLLFSFTGSLLYQYYRQ